MFIFNHNLTEPKINTINEDFCTSPGIILLLCVWEIMHIFEILYLLYVSFSEGKQCLLKTQLYLEFSKQGGGVGGHRTAEVIPPII